MTIQFVCYAGKPETPVYRSLEDGKGKGVCNKVLMGTWLGVTRVSDDGAWYLVTTAGPGGWVQRSDTRTDCGLKVFFLDVGQGDAAFIETQGKRLIVDAGKNRGLYDYLQHWQYTWLLHQGKRVHIDDVVISHFDGDHFEGMIALLNDRRFSFGTVHHNGIARFNSRAARRPAAYDTALGARDPSGHYLITSFDSLEDLVKLRDLDDPGQGGLARTFAEFADACVSAAAEGRLAGLHRVEWTGSEADFLPGYDARQALSVRVLGPARQADHSYRWFGSASKTVNGHSVVLRLEYGGRRVLLAGDLNRRSESHLLAQVGGQEFLSDVVKVAHHGADDFDLEFLRACQPWASVISSGDNEDYAHPQANVLGAVAKHSRGDTPLLFSTELARSVNADEITYGIINLRIDEHGVGVMAQMKEQHTSANVWDAYELPTEPAQPPERVESRAAAA